MPHYVVRPSHRRQFSDTLRRSLLLVLVIGAALGMACADSEVVTASYATLEEARTEGAIAGGWLPEGLPAGTSELRSAHNRDASRRWGLFSFPQSEREALRQLLSAAEVSLTGVSVDIPGRVEWWPVLLRGALNEEQIRATGLRAYRSTRGDLLFLVNWEQGRAYFWASTDARR